MLQAGQLQLDASPPTRYDAKALPQTVLEKTTSIKLPKARCNVTMLELLILYPLDKVHCSSLCDDPSTWLRLALCTVTAAICTETDMSFD